MKRIVLALGLVIALAGCAAEPSRQASSNDAPNRDGFSGQIGVSAGDPSDYGK